MLSRCSSVKIPHCATVRASFWGISVEIMLPGAMLDPSRPSDWVHHSALRFITGDTTTLTNVFLVIGLDFSLWPWNIIMTGPYLFLKPWLGLPVPGLHSVILFEVFARHSLEHDLKPNCAELLEGFQLLLYCSLLTCDGFYDFNGLACKIWLNVRTNEWKPSVNPNKNLVFYIGIF